MNLKKINKVLIYTLLVFSLFTFSVYPKSHAKYFKEDESLFYGLNLNKLFIGENDTISYVSGTNYSTVKYRFSFNRSTLLKSDDDSLNYKIVVDDVCSIDSVSGDGSKSINGNTATIKFTDNTESEIIVYYSCSVDDLLVNESDLDFVTSSFKVYETYKPDNIEYLYTKGSDKILLSDYYEKYPLPTGIISDDKKTLTIPNIALNKYDTFTSWLSEYANTYGSAYTSDLSAYIETVYNDEDTILDTSLSLRGISVTNDSSKDQYVYELEDNVIGYARTSRSYNKNNMYFSDKNMTDDEITEVLTYYLNTYVYPDDSETATKVLEYILNKGGINKLISGECKIPGLIYGAEEDVVNISTNILSIITASESSPVFATHTTQIFDMFDSIAAGLTSNYSFITDAVIDYLNNNCYDFVNLWIKTGEAFNEYFVITPVTQDSDGNDITHNSILFHIYSNYIESDETTHVNYVTATELISGMEVKVEYSIDDIESAKSDLNTINTTINKEVTLDDNMFTISGTYNDGYYTSVVTDSTITISFVIE